MNTTSKLGHKLKILYISYWGFNEGITVASVLPSLKVLIENHNVEKIFLVSIERDSEVTISGPYNEKVNHIPLYSKKKLFLIDKIYDFVKIPSKLRDLCYKEKIEKIICRSSLAGAIGYLLWRKTKIPYYVESFEPHADYMLEGAVWSKWDPRYLSQKYFEKKQRNTAAGLMPVSKNYFVELEEDTSIKCDVITVPCTVSLSDFEFSNSSRSNIRRALNIERTHIVGVYVGKFGGIYYDNRSFNLFKKCFDVIDNFFLLLLTPHSKEFLQSRIIKHDISEQYVRYENVLHKNVPEYLSASDVAFCPVKSTPSRRHCSPIKNGEYWANGLPIVIPKGIGEDSEIIINNGGGLVVDIENGVRKDDLNKLLNIILNSNKNRIENQSVENARQYRGQDSIKFAYKRFIFNEH